MLGVSLLVVSLALLKLWVSVFLIGVVCSGDVKQFQVTVTFPCSDRCDLNLNDTSYLQLGQGPVDRLALRWDSMGYENGP